MSRLRAALVGPEQPPVEWLDRLESEGGVDFCTLFPARGIPAACEVGVVWVDLEPARAREWVEEAMRRPPFPLVVAGPAPGDEPGWTRRGVVLVFAAGRDEQSGLDQGDLLRLAASVVPVAHPRLGRGSPASLPLPAIPSPQVPVVGVASSTGGPRALGRLLSRLPPETPGCLLVVQHMGSAFLTSLRDTLQRTTELEVAIAGVGDRLQSGRVYLAPADLHLELAAGGRLSLCPPGEPRESHVPAADRLFESIARVCGERSTAVVLSGMGRDGAEGARAIRAAGGKVSAQSAETCVIPGMPEAASAAGAVHARLSPAELALWLTRRLRALSSL